MKIILCRHGQTDRNIDRTIKGQDENLVTTFTEEGKKQINHLSQYIVEKGIEAVFSSDMPRAVQTAKIALENLQLPLYFSANFRGLNTGDFQGKKVEEFQSSNVVKRVFSDYDYAFPNGESINQLIQRFLKELNCINESYNYKNVAVVTHGAAISNVKAYLSKESFSKIDYCIIQFVEQKWKVLDAGLYNNLFE